MRMSLGEYYHATTAGERVHDRVKLEDKACPGMRTWYSVWPTIKTTRPEQILLHMQVVTLNGMWRPYVEVNLSEQDRKLRWRKQMHTMRYRQQVVDRVAAHLKKEGIWVVAYGSSNFSHTSKGHRTGVRRGWLRQGLIERGFIVVDVNERNTSQVCSKCQ